MHVSMIKNLFGYKKVYLFITDFYTTTVASQTTLKAWILRMNSTSKLKDK